MKINHIPTKFHCPVTGDLIFSEHLTVLKPSKATLFIEEPVNGIEIFDERLQFRVKDDFEIVYQKVEELVGKEPQLFSFYQERVVNGKKINIKLNICIDMAYKCDEFELIN